MPLVNINVLTGVALDYAVATCDGVDFIISPECRREHVHIEYRSEKTGWDFFDYNPSKNIKIAQDIIDRERIEIVRGNDLYFPQGNENGDYYEPLWLSRINGDGNDTHGETALISAMRCYVLSKIDGTVMEIPDELL